MVETGIFNTGPGNNIAASLDTRIFLDVDGAAGNAGVVVATLEDTLSDCPKTR